MSLLFLLAILAIALEPHLRRRAPGIVSLRVALVLFLAGDLLQKFATRAVLATPEGGVPAPAAWIGLLGGLLSWAGLCRLLACDARRRDRIARVVWAVLALSLAPVSVPLSAVFGAMGLFSFRWTRRFSTRPLLAIGLGFVIVMGIGFGVPAPVEGSYPGFLQPALAASRWLVMVTRWYVLIGIFGVFHAFLRDPSLGIRTVGRRLALSHVLVVLVPLVLLGALWTFTTILGVNADRAMVAARALDGEGRELQGVLRDALAAGPGAAARARGSLTGHGGEWSDPRLWLREGGRWRRAVGDSTAHEERLALWLDSLRALPSAAVVGIGQATYYGVARLDPADSSRGAVLLVDADSLLHGGPHAIAGTRLEFMLRDLATRQGSIVQLDAGDASRTRGSRETLGARDDSARIARARQVMRRFGLPDSALGTAGSRAGVTIETPGEDTLQFRPRTPRAVAAVLFDGHALVPGISWAGTHWRSTRTMISSVVDPWTAIAGLYRNLQENPVSVLPLILILTLTALVLLVALFDFALVTGMARSITAAIHALKHGAARLEAGDLAHRVEVRGDDDLWNVAEAFNEAVAGFERSRELEIERRRLEHELALAREIQSRLLPSAPPRVPGLEIAGFYDPAREVGGDYFDHLDLGGGRVLLVIADVSGKGVPAALLMSGFRASLMSQDLSKRDPVELSAHLNDFLIRSVETGRFVTAFLAFADAPAGTIDYVNAGHNPPVLLRADGSNEALEAGGLMFGVMPDAAYRPGRAEFGHGDLLALYTDGVTEGASASRELWGDSRLLESLRRGARRPCGDLAKSVAEEVRDFEGAVGPADDITLLIARRV